MLFRSNSKFDQNLQCSVLQYPLLITTKFCACHDSVWSVKHISDRSRSNFGRISNSIEISLVGWGQIHTGHRTPLYHISLGSRQISGKTWKWERQTHRLLNSWVQNGGNSSALVIELPQPYTKPTIWCGPTRVRSTLQKMTKNTPHSLPLRVRHGMNFVSWYSYVCFSTTVHVIYAIWL